MASEDRPPLALARVVCISRALREHLLQAGLPVADAPVVYGGTAIEPPERLDRPTAPSLGAQFSLVYLGRLVAEKGVHTIVDAVRMLRGEPSRGSITLDIFGAGDPAYVAALRAVVQRQGLQHAVHFRGRLDPVDVPVVLGRYDALVLASEWEEPLGRVVLEAMAVGVPVIATTAGGIGEVLTDGVTGLACRAGDAAMLAAQIVRLQRDPTQRRELARTAQETVVERFSLRRMVDELEAVLRQVDARNLA
jgi:glycogen(starch) synthase